MSQTHFLEHQFGKQIEVPQYNQVFKLGDKVIWLVESKRKGGHKPFEATGRVTKLYATTFGGHKRKQAARIETGEEYQKVFLGRLHTTVAVDKLKHF